MLLVIHKTVSGEIKTILSGRWISSKNRISNDRENEKRSAIFQIQSAT